MSTMKMGLAARRRLTTALVVVATALAASASPAAAESNDVTEEAVGVGYFYGTFGQSPNIALLVGGTAEEFCDANPDDPFNAEPGMTTQRVFVRSDGSVDLKVNDRSQPIHLYEIEFDTAPEWIEHVCALYFSDGTKPDPFASGTARLKVRVTIVSEDYVEVFNSANGRATGTDGTRYRVRASADLVVEDGMPVGNPEDFVSFQLREINRRPSNCR